MAIDLHIHSNLSDGDDSVLEIVSKVHNKGIELFSITDHDNINSINILNQISNICYIPGVEMSASLRNVKLHILGYGINPNGYVSKICKDVSSIRKTATFEILEDLRKKGYVFDNEYLERFFKNDDLVLSKVDISKMLVSCGYAQNISYAFNVILKPYNIGAKIRQDAKKVINAIKEDSGISIVAHPGNIIKKQDVDIIEVIDELKYIGLDGIEVFTTAHNEKMQYEFFKIARERNMLISGGSDYHGELTKPNIHLCDNVKEGEISEKIKKKCIKH